MTNKEFELYEIACNTNGGTVSRRELVMEPNETKTPLASIWTILVNIRDIQTVKFCNLIDDLVNAKDVGGSNFNDAGDMLVRLLEYHNEIKTLDYVLDEIRYACGESK